MLEEWLWRSIDLSTNHDLSPRIVPASGKEPQEPQKSTEGIGVLLRDIDPVAKNKPFARARRSLAPVR
jgi:hypothetical protein